MEYNIIWPGDYFVDPGEREDILQDIHRLELMDYGFCLGLLAALAGGYLAAAETTAEQPKDRGLKLEGALREKLQSQWPEIDEIADPVMIDGLVDDVRVLLGGLPVERTDTYERYIQSERWRRKAEAAKERAGHRCQLCNTDEQPLHTHHKSYERLRHELPEDLIVLCADCHAKFHDKLPPPQGEI